MSANAVVRAHIDERIKEEETVVLAAMGLTVSDALPGLVLIYRKPDDTVLQLVRLGSHSELGL